MLIAIDYQISIEFKCVPPVPSSRTISTLENNKLTIGVLGDSDRYIQLKTHQEKTFGDRVKIQFDGNNKTNYQTLKDNIARQKLDIVFTLSPMISITAKDNGYTWIAKMFATKPFYKSVLFVKADSPIQSLNDLQPSKDSGLRCGNQRRHQKVTRISRKSLTEKSHCTSALEATSLNHR